MNATRLLKILLGVSFVFGLVGQAHADPMFYTVHGTLSGGAQITGSMEIDSDGGPGNYIVPSTWMFMTSGGVDPNGSPVSNFTYTPTSSSLLFDLAFLTFIGTDFNTGRSLTFASYSPLLNQPGPYTIGSIMETYKYSNSFQILDRTFTHDKFATRDGSGSAASLPEPSSTLLLGSGLAALGALRFRKGKKV